MPRDTSTDTLTVDLINAFVNALTALSDWGVLSDGNKAVYPGLAYPLPQEPFPCAYVGLLNQPHDYGQGTGLRRDTHNVAIRILGGPDTPKYKFNPELAIYSLLTGVVNELTWRRFLEDPTNGDTPFRYIDPQVKVTVGDPGRIRSISYGEQGNYIGIELPCTVMTAVNLGRLS